MLYMTHALASIKICTSTHLKIVAQELKDNGIILSEKKAEFNRTRIDFLGLTLENGGVQLQLHVLTFLGMFPNEFENRKSVQRFLGCINYADSHYLPNMGPLRAPLQAKLKINNGQEAPWNWTPAGFSSSCDNQAGMSKDSTNGSPKRRRSILSLLTLVTLLGQRFSVPVRKSNRANGIPRSM
jgi:hypothetical protein